MVTEARRVSTLGLHNRLAVFGGSQVRMISTPEEFMARAEFFRKISTVSPNPQRPS